MSASDRVSSSLPVFCSVEDKCRSSERDTKGMTNSWACDKALERVPKIAHKSLGDNTESTNLSPDDTW